MPFTSATNCSWLMGRVSGCPIILFTEGSSSSTVWFPACLLSRRRPWRGCCWAGCAAGWLRVGIGSPSFHKRPFVLAVGRAGKSVVELSAGALCLGLGRLTGEGERVRSALTEAVGLFSRFLAGAASSGPGSPPPGGGSEGARWTTSSALSLPGACRGWSLEGEGAAVSLASVGAVWSLQRRKVSWEQGKGWQCRNALSGLAA